MGDKCCTVSEGELEHHEMSMFLRDGVGESWSQALPCSALWIPGNCTKALGMAPRMQEGTTKVCY